MFMAALSRGDARGAAEVFADDAWLLAPSTELIAGRTAIEAYWLAGIGAGVRRVDLTALGVEPRDGLIFEVGRYTIDLDSIDDGIAADCGTYVVLHRQVSGSKWAWAVGLFSPDFEVGQHLNKANREGVLR